MSPPGHHRAPDTTADPANEDVPVEDTTDLRAGAPIHDALLALLPLVGEWFGTGTGVAPATGQEFTYAQRVTFAHDGRPFLAYDSRTWLVDEDGELLGPAARETGFWRPGAGPDDVEAVLALNTGLGLVLEGLALEGAAGDARWELTSSDVERTGTAATVEGSRRLYAILDGDLAYAQEIAQAGAEFTPHLTARLHRQ